MSTDRRTGDLYCDFCGKSQHEVDTLIRGPSVEICDECIPLAQQRVSESCAARAAGAYQGSDTAKSATSSTAQGGALSGSPVPSNLRQAATDALAAYDAIGMGPRGWNERDRQAFAALRKVLAPTPPAPPETGEAET